MNGRFVFVVFLIVVETEAVIYKLNESEYDKMPPLYAMDDYDRCMLSSEGVYCVADYNLYSGTNDELMNVIQEYSKYKIKHFNHSEIHRGVCVTRNCKELISKINDTEKRDLSYVLEACLNRSVYSEYSLCAKLNNIQYCNKAGETLKIDSFDIILGVVYLALIILNVIGSLYDITKQNKIGNPYLLAFSIPKNWARLTAPSSYSKEPRLERLKLFNGLRTVTMICVFFSHTSIITSFSYVQNPDFIENAYEDPLKQLLFNGSLVIQTFFLMSSFLLSYNFMLQAEKYPISWTHLPKGILLRWLRLTPTYALVLGTIMTWMRHMYVGPLWELVVISEAKACRQYWWTQLLYINNYVYDNAYCMPQTWYLAADTQLFCVGLLVCVVARTTRARMVTLSVLLAAALSIVAGHIYIQDLDAVVVQSPEYYRNVYATDANFRLLYTRGHTNIASCIVGLAAGFLAYQGQNLKNTDNLKKYRWVMWLAFPMGVGVILSGGLFYMDGPRAPMVWRVLYGTFHKPLFQMCVISIILGCVFQLESVYRGIIEWRGFTWTGRVSYSAFLLHTLFQRALIGAQKQPIYMTGYYVVVVLSATTILTYVSAAILWVTLEAPAAALVRVALTPSGSPQRNNGDKNIHLEDVSTQK